MILSLHPTLRQVLRAVTRRLRLHDWLNFTGLTLTGGLTITLLLIIAGKLYPLAWPMVLLTAGLGGTVIALIASSLYALFRPCSRQRAASVIDQTLGLDERFSTALELTQQQTDISANIVTAQLEDTLQQLTNFKVGELFPFRVAWTRVTMIALLALAIFVSLLLPNPQIAVLEQQARVEQLITEQTAQLESIQAELLENKELLETLEGQELVETLEELIEALKEDNLTQAEAIATLSEAEQKLAELEDLAEQEGALNQLAETFSQYDSTADLAEAIQDRNMEKAAELLDTLGEDGQADPDTAQDLADALQQAAEAMQQAGHDELGQALAEAAEAMADAAQNGDAQAMQDALNQAAEAIAQAGGQPGNQEALEEALSNIQQAREQLAQQGEGNGQGAGQGQGEDSPGDGQTEQQGAGAGAGGSGRGDPSEGAEGLLSEQGAPNSMDTDNGPNENKVEDYDSIAIPQHLGGEGGPVVKPDEQGAEGGIPIGDAPINPDSDNSSAIVPYNEVYSEYNEAANDALDNNYIPLGMKGYVREYFGALEPE